MCDTHRDALGEGLGRGAVGHVAAYEHEPFGVHVRDDIAWTCQGAKARRDRFDEVRAGLVAEPFVHVREVVQLDRHDRNAPEDDFSVGQPPAEPVEIEDRNPRLAGITRVGRRCRVGDLSGATFDRRSAGSLVDERDCNGDGCVAQLVDRFVDRSDHRDRQGFRRRDRRDTSPRNRSGHVGDHDRRLEQLGNEVGGASRASARPKGGDGRTDRHRGGDRPHDDQQRVVHNQLSEACAPTLSGAGPRVTSGTSP